MTLFSTSLAAQLPKADPFSIDSLSTSSTLPGPDGLRLVSVSFRITNTAGFSIVPPSPAIATIAISTNTANLDVPALQPGATAFVSSTVQTAAPNVTISISVAPKSVVVSNGPALANPKPTSQQAAAASSKAAATPSPKTGIKPATAPAPYTITVAGDLGRWQSVGPFKINSSPAESGRVTAIAIDPRNPEIVYAGARGSGLWKTLGVRMIWLPLTDSLPSQQIEALALDPNNPDHLVIATGAGVFESFNDGSVWTLLTSTDLQAIGSDGGKLLIASGTNPAMFVTTTNGVKASTDGGRTWAPVLSNNGIQASSIQFSSTDPTHLFATLGTVNGPGPQPGVFEATNGGTTTASWHQLQGCPSAPLPSFPTSSNVWVAESQGSMWVSYRTGGADNDQLGMLHSTSATCTVNGFAEHGWQSVSLSSDCSQYVNNWSYLFIDPNDPTIIYKGGIGLCRATGSGASSSLMSNIHADQHAIAVAASNPSVVYFGSDGGIYRSNDQGKTVSFAGEGMSNTEFLSADVDGTGAAIIGASQDNGIESWDGTSSSVWKYIDNSVDGDGVLVSVDQANPAGFYWMSQGTAAIYQNSSTKIGDSSLGDCGSYSEFPGSVFLGMVSTGTTPALYVTCNGLWTGPPWKQVQADDPNKFKRLGFYRGSLGRVAAATDKGDVFYGVPSLPPLAYIYHDQNAASASSIAFENENSFYVSMNTVAGAGLIYHLQYSTSWIGENVWPGNTNGTISAITVDPVAPNTLLAAIPNKGIFRGVRAPDGTWTWAPYNNGLPAAVSITDLRASRSGSIAAVSYGRGAYTITSASVQPPVPNVIGLTEAGARQDIASAGYTVGTVSSSFSSAVTGTVVSQNPSAGVVASAGSAVSFTVATGDVIVPNVLGFSQKDATTALTALGLVTQVGSQKACVNPGDVLIQSPQAGTAVAPGSTVHLTVDSGSVKTCIIK